MDGNSNKKNANITRQEFLECFLGYMVIEKHNYPYHTSILSHQIKNSTSINFKEEEEEEEEEGKNNIQVQDMIMFKSVQCLSLMIYISPERSNKNSSRKPFSQGKKEKGK